MSIGKRRYEGENQEGKRDEVLVKQLEENVVDEASPFYHREENTTLGCRCSQEEIFESLEEIAKKRVKKFSRRKWKVVNGRSR